MAASLSLRLPLPPSSSLPVSKSSACQPSTSESCSLLLPRFSNHVSASLVSPSTWVDLKGGSRVLGRRERKRRVACALADGSSNGASGDGTTASPDRPLYASRREMLLEYVKNVQPEIMERFVKRAPDQVVEAMRQTVTNMLGTLPPQFFDVTVSTVAENLAQLMYSVMMTGYMFRNAQYRLDLQNSLAQAALPESNQLTFNTRYAPGVQKTRVSGDVVRWHNEEGAETMAAVEYIELLESEIVELKKQLEQRGRASGGRNELLGYLKSLQPQNIQELTTSAGEDALEAMNTFIQRLLGVADSSQIKRAATETTAAELAKLLYWLMVVGYSIRNIEVRYDMERVLGMPAKIAELPPGEAI